jgi:hypothetical protein
MSARRFSAQTWESKTEAVAYTAMQVSRALLEQSLHPRTASLLLWSLQIAKSTIRNEDDNMTR